jgi:hypothetical protein
MGGLSLSIVPMFNGYRFVGILLLAISDFSQAFAETTKFPLGHSWYVSCSKIAPLDTKKDARPGINHIEFGFSDTQQRHVDLIVGPVKSDAETVQSTFDPDAPLRWSLSRVTGVLTITDVSRALEAKYMCERSSFENTF